MAPWLEVSVNLLPGNVFFSVCVRAHTHCEEHKILLVVLSDTVVDPGAVVVHLLNAALAHTLDGHTHTHTHTRLENARSYRTTGDMPL
jgi:hypothetical protein